MLLPKDDDDDDEKEFAKSQRARVSDEGGVKVKVEARERDASISTVQMPNRTMTVGRRKAKNNSTSQLMHKQKRRCENRVRSEDG